MTSDNDYGLKMWEENAQQGASLGASILVVDDEPANVALLQYILEDAGYTNIRYTTDSRQVLPMHQKKPADLLLLDLMMPEMDGFQVMEQLKAATPGQSYLPILVLTADVTRETRLKALAMGATDFLTKPVDSTDLLLRIRNLLRIWLLHVQLHRRNQELEAFSYSVSHDLRAPLRHIDGFAHALLEDYAPGFDDLGKHYLQRIRAASQQMGQLIDALLNLSRLSTRGVCLEPVNLTRMARAVLENLMEASPDRKVEVIVDEEMVVTADAGLMERVLDNLIRNAWKFTRDREITRIHVGQMETEDQKVFFVKDNGAGFDMAHNHKLFQAFERLHSPTDFEGTGIGLATVRRALDYQGGRIWADAAVGDGATFYFALP